MELTTLLRVKRLLDIESNTAEDDALSMIISGVSGAIEDYLNRDLELKARTEVISIQEGQQVIQLQAYPISASPAPVFRNNWSQDFSSSIVAAANYYVDLREGKKSTGQVRLTGRYSLIPGEGVFQAVYTGGMGHTAVSMVAAISAVSGDFTADEVVTGGTSKARGKLTAAVVGASVQISLDVLSGKFVAGETLTGLSSGRTCTLGAISVTPIIFEFPEVIRAAETQIVHEWKRKDTMGLLAMSADGGNVSMETPTYELLAGVQKTLARLRNLGA